MNSSFLFAFVCTAAVFLTAGTCSKSDSENTAVETEAADTAKIDETSPYEAEILDDASTELPPEEIPE